MEIVVVANCEKRINEIMDDIVHNIEDAEIYSFIDPMLAVKYIYNHPVDLVFTEENLKHLTGDDFIKLIKKKHPEIDVSIVKAQGE